VQKGQVRIRRVRVRVRVRVNHVVRSEAVQQGQVRVGRAPVRALELGLGQTTLSAVRLCTREDSG